MAPITHTHRLAGGRRRSQAGDGQRARLAPAAALTAGIMMVAAGAPAAMAQFQVVAKTGDTAPSAGGATYAAAFSDPAIDELGRVRFNAFLGQVGSITSSNDNLLAFGVPGSLTQVEWEGTTPAPGTTGSVFTGSVGVPGGISFNGNGGYFGFFGTLTGGTGLVTTGTSANHTGLWSGTAGSLGLLARANQAAPGLGGAVFASSAFSTSGLIVNSTGESAFFANLRTSVGGVTSSNDRTMWTGTPGSLSLVAREGAAAPGTTGATFGTLSTTPSLSRNSSGRLAFTSTLTGGDTVAGVNDAGIWIGTAGSLSLTMRKGGAAPGAGGAVFGEPNSVAQDSGGAGGRVMFTSSLSGAGVTSANDAGLWSGLPGSYALVARKGDAAPGAAGFTFTAVGTYSTAPTNFVRQYNGGGRVVFGGTIGDGSVDVDGNPILSYGLWRGEPGSVAKLVVDGDVATGAGGAQFVSLFTSFSSLIANEAGQVAFTSSLTGTGVDATNNGGLFAADPLGNVSMLLRKGDLFDVNNDPFADDLRTIADFFLMNITDDRAAALNESGQLTFRLSFTDGTQAIAVTALSIPTPGSLGVAVLGCAAMLRRRRR